MIRLTALACGLLCGFGMVLSGLFQPSLLPDFAIPAGAWGPALGLGLLSALCVAGIVLALTRRLPRPLFGGQNEPLDAATGRKVVAGGVLVGLGWGLAGYIPLAAVVSLGLFAPGAAVFLTSVLVGMVLHDIVTRRDRPEWNSG
ncbi:DUF6691 family protein [Elioraea sp.]|uniref:DUF6691 family protein n=1 Tax=Elioraea sp. TaxID=2185103 RepID=UPI0025BE50BE|nr:DUF6691 family protein [Elioraea sp.]